MEDFKQYRRTQIAEMADWHEGFDMERVSVSAPDAEAGSPKAGDKIARNPANHDDRWLVAATYFAANFEPVAGTTPDAPLTCKAIVGGTPGDAGGTLSYCGLPLPCPEHDTPRDEVTP